MFTKGGCRGVSEECKNRSVYSQRWVHKGLGYFWSQII